MHPVELNEPLSGFQKHMGYELVEWSDGFAKLIMPIGPHLLNREGIPHGGALATVLDTAMGFAGSYTGDPDKPHIVMTLKSIGELHGKSEWHSFDHNRQCDGRWI
jgi:acyl-coenzyme A thioesterase PaaI-like protein